MEFADKDSAKTALALDESLFKGRQLKVCVYQMCNYDLYACIHSLTHRANVYAHVCCIAHVTIL